MRNIDGYHNRFENGTCTKNCYGYEDSAGTCHFCPPDQCLETRKGKWHCRELYPTEIKDVSYNYCSCKPFYGYNQDYSRCIPCKSDECIDYQTKHCVPLSSDEVGIDMTTGFCKTDCFLINPINQSCNKCPEGCDYNKKICSCKKQDEFITEENVCDICPLGQTIQYLDNTCHKCNPDEGINPFDQNCSLPHYFEVIDPITKNLVQCDDSECIDPSTKECIPIPDDKAISPLDGTCVTCPSTSIIDTDTKKCICPKGQGYDQQFGTCQSCQYGIDPLTYKCTNCLDLKQGIDHDTKFCKKCELGEGIDMKTLECSTCPNGVSLYPDSPVCACPPNQGLNNESNSCIQCPEGEGIDINTNKCGKCPFGLGIDPITNKCIECPFLQGIDSITGMCRKCTERQGIDPITKKCRECNRGQGISRIDGKCQICPGSQFIDGETLKCSCKSGQIVTTSGSCCYDCHGLIYNDQVNCTSCSIYSLVLNSTSKKCEECPPNTAYYNYACEELVENYCIFNGVWYDYTYSSNIIRDNENHLCKCELGYGTEYSNVVRCIRCNKFEGTDHISGQCRICDYINGEAIDQNTRECRKRQNEEEAINRVSLTWTKKYENSHVKDNFWECDDGYGFDSTGEKCIQCTGKTNYVDQYTGQCSSCSNSNQVIISETNKCICEEKHGLDDNNNCVKCSDDEGIDPISFHCRKCNTQEYEAIDVDTGFCRYCTGENEGMIRTNNLCIKCPQWSRFDESTHMCKCPYNTGLDANTLQCVSCASLGKGIDPITRECITCEKSESIDDETGFCVNCGNKENYCVDKQTSICRKIQYGEKNVDGSICRCSPGFGRDPETGKCKLCAINEGYDPINDKCKACGKGEGVNRWTSECQICGDGLGINKTTYRCIHCPKGEGINPDTNECEPCGEGKGIDFITKKCTSCLEDQIIDSETRYCMCKNKQGLNEDGTKCIDCSFNEAIDPETRKCIKLYEQECIHPNNGERLQITFKINSIAKDENTGLCVCEDKRYCFHIKTNRCVAREKGQIFNPEQNTCDDCPEGQALDPENTLTCKPIDHKNHEAIDPITKTWTKCKDDQGIDDISGECVECPLFGKINVNNFRCECDEGMALDIHSWMCVKCFVGEGINLKMKTCEPCLEGQGTDKVTGECVYCPPKQGINTETGICGQCPPSLGIHPTSKKCVQCPTGKGILSDSLECGDCPSGFGISQSTKYCVQCEKSEIINETTKMCSKCDEGLGYDENTNGCKQCKDSNCRLCTIDFNICTGCKDSYKLENGQCVLSEHKPGEVIPPVEVTPFVPETSEADVAETSNGIFELVKDDNYKDKTCNVDSSKIKGGTVVIKDNGQKQTQISFTENGDSNKITIEQSSNKPLDINVQSSKPVEVTIINPELTSVKGKGQLTINNKDNQKSVPLESIIPTFNEILKIISNTQIQAEKLELYGNSKVEFENNQGALIKTVAVQQKAETTLENVEISSKLIAGLQTSIIISENVKISNAQLELSDSSNRQNIAVFKGKLNDCPNLITIKDRNDGEILDNKNEFIIAESDSPDFKCDDWAQVFDVKANSKYNRASCNKEGNSVKLVADNTKDDSKGGLKPGVIAAIVIVVVVVVGAVVFVLVYFLVIRKKKEQKSQNEDSMPDEEI